MKKLALTIAVVLGMAIVGNAQQSNNGGGLFQRGAVSDDTYYGYGGYAFDRTGGALSLGLPNGHNLYDDHDAAPLGSGLALLIGLGGTYLVANRRRED